MIECTRCDRSKCPDEGTDVGVILHAGKKAMCGTDVCRETDLALHPLFFDSISSLTR